MRGGSERPDNNEGHSSQYAIRKLCRLAAFVMTQLPLKYISFFFLLFNPFTLRVSLESVVCYSHIFENNF